MTREQAIVEALKELRSIIDEDIVMDALFGRGHDIPLAARSSLAMSDADKAIAAYNGNEFEDQPGGARTHV